MHGHSFKPKNMIPVEFTEEERNELYEIIFHKFHHKTRLKSLALYLKSLEMKHKDICHICRISRSTLRLYIDSFIKEGLEPLRDKR